MNCKPGDLAIVISSKNYPHLVGIIIKIKCASDKFEGYWLPEKAILSPCRTRAIHFKDATLRPVSGLPMEEETQETIKEKA